MERLLRVDDRVSLALFSAQEASALLLPLEGYDLVTIKGFEALPEYPSNPINLTELFRFKNIFINVLAEKRTKHLVLCSDNNCRSRIACIMLVGSMKILIDKVKIEDVHRMFASELKTQEDLYQVGSQVGSLTNSNAVSVFDCWRALDQAQSNLWLEMMKDEVDIDCSIDMQEYVHYDNPLNGGIHVVIPSRLIAFKRPAVITDTDAANASSNSHWVDKDGERSFAPTYYADILSTDFDVKLVVRCDGAKPTLTNDYSFLDESEEEGTFDEIESKDNDSPQIYDETAFEDAGVVVERLCLDQGSRGSPAALFSSVDRFLTLARLAPGAVAIHGGEGDGLGDGAELLVSSLLIRSHGFDARSALAWIRMVHPTRRPAQPLSYSFVPLAKPLADFANQAFMRSWLSSDAFCQSAPAALGGYVECRSVSIPRSLSLTSIPELEQQALLH